MSAQRCPRDCATSASFHANTGHLPVLETREIGAPAAIDGRWIVGQQNTWARSRGSEIFRVIIFTYSDLWHEPIVNKPVFVSVLFTDPSWSKCRISDRSADPKERLSFSDRITASRGGSTRLKRPIMSSRTYSERISTKKVPIYNSKVW